MRNTSLKSGLSSFLLFTLVIVSFVSSLNAQITVSQDWSDAIDYAVQLMLKDSAFTSKYQELMGLTNPLCSSSLSAFPANNPFVGRTNLTMCFEDDAVYPYSEVFHLVGKKIISLINTNYKTNLAYAYRTYNLAALGFFETMVQAVNSGGCDVVTSNVAINPTRELKAHFQCSYGFSSPAYIRSNLDPNIVTPTVTQLNRTDVKVGFLKGTIYQTTVETQLSGSQLVPYGDYVSLYAAASSSAVHAIVGDAVEFSTYLKQLTVNGTSNCANCTVKLFSDPYFFGTITTKNINRLSLGISIFQSGTCTFLLSILLSVIYLI